MPRPSNHQRDLEIVQKIDELGWTFRRTQLHYNMLSVSSVHKAYERGRKLREGTRIKLSTVNVL